MARRQARATKPTVKGGLAPADAVVCEGKGMQRPGATPAAGLAWTHPAAQFVYPQCEGRDVHRCFGNRALSWALLCIGDVTWRGFEPQRLTPASAALPDWPHSARRAPLIRRGKLQVTPPMQPAMGSRASGRLSGCQGNLCCWPPLHATVGLAELPRISR